MVSKDILMVGSVSKSLKPLSYVESQCLVAYNFFPKLVGHPLVNIQKAIEHGHRHM